MLIQHADGIWFNLPTGNLYSLDRNENELILRIVSHTHLVTYCLYRPDNRSEWPQMDALRRTHVMNLIIVWFTHAIVGGVLRLPQSAFREAYHIIEPRVIGGRPDEEICDQLLTHATFACKRWVVTTTGPVCIDELPDFVYGQELSFIKDGRTYALLRCSIEEQAKLVFFIAKQTRGIFNHNDMRQALSQSLPGAESTTSNTRRVVID